MNMHEYATQDKQLEFFVKGNPRTFLFIEVSDTDTYEYVVTKLHKVTDIGLVRVTGTSDILQMVENISNISILLCVDPTDSSLLKRLDYLRDSLYALNKLLIFIFFTQQYNTVIGAYPDFAAYSNLFLDYSIKLPVPFTLIFSNNLISNDKKRTFAVIANQEIREDLDEFSLIVYEIDKLKNKKMNSIELQKLDDDIFKLLNNDMDVNTIESMLQSTKMLYNKEQFDEISQLLSCKEDMIAYFVLEYLKILCNKERFDLVTRNLISLCNFCEKREKEYIDIDEVYLECLTYFTKQKKEIFSSFDGYMFDDIARILIHYYCYLNNYGDLTKALHLSLVCVRKIQNEYSPKKRFLDNLLAESVNDTLILWFMIEGNTRERIGEIEFLKYLKLNYENVFLYYHNKVVLLLLSENYEDALAACNEFLESYVYSENSGMAYYRIALIRNWIRGMFDRHLQEAIKSNLEILKCHRSVFAENHYSIAEIHFCNAYMYYEMRNIERSKHCIKKAQNILNQNHSARLSRLRDQVGEFALKLESEK